jgi:N-acetylated-alpha-linked acidic dipeptidase
VPLRLANADILPFRFGPFVSNVKTYRDEVMELLETTRKETERRNALVAANAYSLSADPTKTYVPPGAQEDVPYLSFAPVQNAIARLSESAEAYDRAVVAALGMHNATDIPEGDLDGHMAIIEAINATLIGTERAMTRDDGLPRRSWFRHQIYAPGYYTGYGVKTLPGIREAIEQREWAEAAEQVDRVAGTLERISEQIDEATRRLSP